MMTTSVSPPPAPSATIQRRSTRCSTAECTTLLELELELPPGREPDCEPGWEPEPEPDPLSIRSVGGGGSAKAPGEDRPGVADGETGLTLVSPPLGGVPGTSLGWYSVLESLSMRETVRLLEMRWSAPTVSTHSPITAVGTSGTTPSSRRAMSRAVSNRSSGCFARACATIASSSGGIPWR
jgi:hypothetical protein